MGPLPTKEAHEYHTGHRVPADGWYVDQRGVMTRHHEHGTFPPLCKTSVHKGGGTGYYRFVSK